MQRRIVAQQLAQKLYAVEDQIDQTIGAAGALMAALPDARSRARVSAVVGQDAFDLVAQATVILAQARGKLVAAHHALAAASEQVGIPVTSIGSGTKGTVEGGGGIEHAAVDFRGPRAA